MSAARGRLRGARKQFVKMCPHMPSRAQTTPMIDMEVARTGVDDIEPGFVLEHRGSRLGVVERVDHGDGGEPSLVHVRGGCSGSLEYLVPGSDLVAVDRASARSSISA